MKRAFTRKRILAVAKMAQQPAVDGPDRGHGVLLPGSGIGALEAGETGGLQPIVFVDGFAEGGNQQAFIHEIAGAVHGSLQPQRQSYFAGQQLQFGELGVLLIVFLPQGLVLVT